MQSRNSALYVSSRTLFVLAQRSKFGSIKRTLGRTNNGHTPLVAIFVSFLPGLLAFLAVNSANSTFREVSPVLFSIIESHSLIYD